MPYRNFYKAPATRGRSIDLWYVVKSPSIILLGGFYKLDLLYFEFIFEIKV